MVSLVYNVRHDLLPLCYRAFPSKDPASAYLMRPLVVPIAPSGARLSATGVRERLQEVAKGFGGAFVDGAGVVASPFGLHWDNSVVSEARKRVECSACGFLF